MPRVMYASLGEESVCMSPKFDNYWETRDDCWRMKRDAGTAWFIVTRRRVRAGNELRIKLIESARERRTSWLRNNGMSAFVNISISIRAIMKSFCTKRINPRLAIILQTLVCVYRIATLYTYVNFNLTINNYLRNVLLDQGLRIVI